MERIKKAVERARQEREAAVPPGPIPVAPSPVSSPQTALPPSSDQAAADSQLRVAPVSEGWFRRHRVHAALQNDEVSDAYRILRTAVLQRMRANGWSSLAVTSPSRGAGKTLTAVNLAVSLAHAVSNPVVLVDLDLRRPRVRSYFSNEKLPGVGDYLMGEAQFGDLLLNPGVDRLVVLPGRGSFSNSSEMLSSSQMAQLIREIETRFPTRIVLFDMPPLLVCDDVMAFSPHVDAVLLVVEDGGTVKEELQRSAELLAGLNLIGSVLNKSSEARTAYGYY